MNMARYKKNSPPLCVDLDGTLVRTDTLVEQLLTLARRPPAVLLRLLPALLRGKAKFKSAVSGEVDLDVSTLPYNRELLAYLRQQKSSGRKIVLATAANQRIAHAVAKHLQLFDAVIASNDQHNLRGRAKGDALRNQFGNSGFTYAGNDQMDLPIWHLARAAVVVNAPTRLIQQVRDLVTVEHQFDRQVSRWRALLRAMRPYQWIKNGLVFVPMMTAGAFLDAISWLYAATAFASFCATASGIYLINDLFDVDADRRHRQKYTRPFASGDLPLGVGLIAAPLLLALGLSIALYAGVALLVTGYAVLSITYSVKLKELPLVDIFALSLLYTVRMLAGGDATDHSVSLWLLGFSGFFFFSLATIKRVAELKATDPQEAASLLARRGYSPGDVSALQAMGIGSSFVSALVLALYVQDNTAIHHQYPKFLWGIVPLILFWQCRLWLSTSRGYMLDDPIVYSAKDWVTYVVALAVIAVLAIDTLY